MEDRQLEGNEDPVLGTWTLACLLEPTWGPGGWRGVGAGVTRGRASQERTGAQGQQRPRLSRGEPTVRVRGPGGETDQPGSTLPQEGDSATATSFPEDV